MESRTEKLGDIADITTGKTPSKRIENAYGNVIKFLTPRDFSGRFSVTTERMLSDQGYQAVYNQIVSGPSVSVTCIGSDMGKVIYNRESVVTNQQVNTLSNFKSNVDPLFLYYLLSTKKQELLSYGAENGSTMPIITKSMFSKLEIKLPSVKVQRKLVACLSLLDDKIELNQQINKNLLKLGMNIAIRTSNINKSTTCRISDMKDFLTVSDHVANGSFKTLKDNVTIVDKPDYSLFLRNTDLKRNLMGDKRWITKHSYDFLKKSHLYGGEVIISNVGDVGSVHRVPYLDEHMVAGNNVIFIQSADSWITDYLYLYFLSNIGQHALSTITSGSAQQKFNKTDFRAIELPIISKNFVKKNLTPILKKIDSNRVEEDCLITLRDLLLPRLLSGEIDLSIFEEVLKNAK